MAGALLSGCATYTDNLVSANKAAYSGNYAGAVEAVNDIIGVGAADELPAKWGADSSLGTLERGVLLQSLERYADSSRDLSAAEQHIELLELSRDPVGTLGGYIYSDSAKPYQAPASERLALNAFNLLNFIARGDLDGAAVEARRFQTMREYLRAESTKEHGAASLGTFLAGFVFERLGEGDRALRYYEETLASAMLNASLAQPVARLARNNAYRGPNLKALLARGAGDANSSRSEILVVVALGRVPHKVPERMPVGAAIGLAGSYLSGDYRWLTRGATKVVVYPELAATASSLAPQAVVRVDGRNAAAEQVIDFDAAVRSEYQEMKPKILAAALTRVASRAAVAEGVRAAGNQKGDALGEVLSLVVEGAMVAADKPDTRSWTMLPARVMVARVPAAPGEHQIDVEIPGNPAARRSLKVHVADNGFAAAIVTEPR